MRRVLRVWVGPDKGDVRQVLIQEKWLEDEEWLRGMGFGSGDKGLIKALQWFAGVPADELLGVYDGPNPVGFIHPMDMGPERRTVRATPYVCPEMRDTVLHLALREYLEWSFQQPVEEVGRVEVETLSSHKVLQTALKKAGFVQDGKRKDAYWMDDHSHAVVSYGVTRGRWRAMQRKHNPQPKAQEGVA